MEGGLSDGTGTESLRALLVASTLPHPAVGGGDLRNWQNVQALMAAGRVAVVGIDEGKAGPAPHPAIETWRALGLNPGLGGAPLDWVRRPRGHPGDRWFSPEALEQVLALADEFRPHVAVLEQIWLYHYAEPLRELGCRIVVDAHNLEGPLATEIAAGRGDALSAMVARRANEIEAAAFTMADQVWLCSEFDADRARVTYDPDASLVIVPNTIDLDPFEGMERDPEPATLLYPGTFAYPPNVTAADRLLGEIFPPFAERVDRARLVLLGRNPTAPMLSAAEQDPRIEVTGFIRDPRPHMARATAMPVPLLEGSGTRFKVLEAFAAGLPVVSTGKGIEGLDLSAGEHYLAAESAAEFVDALEELCVDADRREELGRRGAELVRRRYSWDAARTGAARGLGMLGLS